MTNSFAAGSGLRVAMISRRVHPAHGPGGLERHVHDLTFALARVGVEIDLVTETPADTAALERAADAFPPRVSLHWIPGGPLPIGRQSGTIVLDRITNYPWWSWRAARWILSRQSDTTRRWSAIHVHGMAGWGVARAAKRGKLSIPMILATQGLEEFQSPQWLKHVAYSPFRACIRTVAAQSRVIVTTDESLKSVVERHLGIPEADQVVIPNVVDADRCRRLASPKRATALLARLRLDQPNPLFISVGRVAPNKGFHLVPAALSGAASALPEHWAWVLVGAGADVRRVRQTVTAMGLDDRCRFAGRLSDEDLHSLYSIAHWFIHPTLYEGSSLVTLEAMAHGLPVIASRTGGLPDKVVHGESGLLVAPGDVAELADAIQMTGTVDATRLGETGRRICESRFGWPVAASAYRQLYASLRESPSAGPARGAAR